MKYLRSLLLLVISISIVSCTSTKKLQQNLNSQSYSMQYLMDSESAKEKRPIRVAVDSVYFNADDFKEQTEVEKLSAMFIPLVFVYVWNSKQHCIQGKSMIKEDLPDFLHESFNKEAIRSGSFMVDSIGKADYTIDLSIDEIKTEGPYVSKGFFIFAIIFHAFTYSDYAGPAMSTLEVSYKLKKDGNIVHENNFVASKITDPIPYKYKTQKNLHENYAISMVEANSLNFKNVISKIVADVDAHVK